LKESIIAEAKMSKRLRFASFLFLLIVFLAHSSVLAGGITKVKISEAMKMEVLVAPTSAPQTAGTVIPLSSDLILTSPGYMVGTTHYDYQTSGSTGNRIVKDALGGIHIVWMNGIGNWQGNRWIYYNFRDETGAWSWPDVGTQVSKIQGSGYCQLSTFSDGRAVPAYHSVPNRLYIVIGVDILRGFGDFDELNVPECPCDSYYVWPYETIDRSGRIHVAFPENSGRGRRQPLCYVRSDDEGISWSEPAVADTLLDISQVLTSSRVSDKVALAFTHPKTVVEPLANQYNNDMCYYESLDGVTWNFEVGIVNVTNYQTDDTLRAYTDCDAIYDYNDNLHLLWNTPYYCDSAGTISDDACLLWHWSEATGITFAANGWWPSTPGAWNRTISKMSLGVDQSNNLFALWTQFTDDDRSAWGRYSNGELYTSYSFDGGYTWSEPENITNSPTPDCWVGECDSDHWSTLAETVDDSLYITYINDKDAGGIPQTEGANVQNNVMYLAVPKPTGEVTMACEALTPVFCRGKNFYFKLLFDNSTGVNVSGALTFSSYSGYDCDPGNLMDNLTRSKTFGPGVTETYYYLRAPYDRYPPGQYSASVSGTIAGFELSCCMNADIVQCSPWRMGDNTTWELVEVDRPEVELPTFTSLSQNYPNPFNANTSISYTLAEAGNANLSVYDISGRLVATLADGYQQTGEHVATWNASEFSSGVYFYKLSTADYTATKKMHLLK
jgi:hypothetical protein